jgi:hypothetical protein
MDMRNHCNIYGSTIAFWNQLKIGTAFTFTRSGKNQPVIQFVLMAKRYTNFIIKTIRVVINTFKKPGDPRFFLFQKYFKKKYQKHLVN